MEASTIENFSLDSQFKALNADNFIGYQMEIPSVDFGYHDNYLAMVLYQYDGILSILHRYRL